MTIHKMVEYTVNLLFLYTVGWNKVRGDLSGKQSGHTLKILNLCASLGQAVWCLYLQRCLSSIIYKKGEIGKNIYLIMGYYLSEKKPFDCMSVYSQDRTRKRAGHILHTIHESMFVE